VKAVIQLKAGFAPDEALRQEILEFARANLAGFKIPRSLDFVDELPRSAAGKILRNTVRARYWAGRSRKI
jgi:long-chain acyl-CoA synthetase